MKIVESAFRLVRKPSVLRAFQFPGFEITLPVAFGASPSTTFMVGRILKQGDCMAKVEFSGVNGIFDVPLTSIYPTRIYKVS